MTPMQKNSAMRYALALLCLFLVASCSPARPVDLPPLSFTRYQPIYLNVSNIEFIEEYKSPLQMPYVEHLIPYSPSEAIHIWIKDRIRAIGSQNVLQIIIKDGSVKAGDVPTPEGWQGWLAFGGERRYDAKLDVELRIYGGGSMSAANAHVVATRSITIPENASVHERKAAFRQMIGDMMTPMNAELEKNIQQYFGNYINYSQNP